MELRPFPAIFREIQPGFSAMQTAWRSGDDSNPRYSFVCGGKRPRVHDLHGVPRHERANGESAEEFPEAKGSAAS